jgi:hypothetical protein
MEKQGQPKNHIEEQFQEMLTNARKLYPDIDITISMCTNIVAQTINLQDYLNLAYQTPSEICNNQTTV